MVLRPKEFEDLDWIHPAQATILRRAIISMVMIS